MVTGEDAWYEYYASRVRIDIGLEAGRPGLDYRAKTLRFHKSVILDAVYVTTNAIYEEKRTEEPMLASCDCSSVAVWNLITGDKIWSEALEQCASRQLVYEESTGYLYCSGKDGKVIYWNAQTGAHQGEISVSSHPISILSIISKRLTKAEMDYILIARISGKLEIWKPTDQGNKPLFSFYTLSSPTVLKISKSMLIASASSPNHHEVRIHDFNSFKEDEEIESIAHLNVGPANDVCWLECNPNLLAVASWDKIVITRVSNNGDNEILQEMFTNVIVHHVLSFSDVLVFDLGDKLRVISLDINGNQKGTTDTKNHIDQITDIHVDPYRVMTCSTDFSIRVYKWDIDAEKGKHVQSLYSLLGGSLQRAQGGFSKIVCDYSTCVGINANLLKTYIFTK